MDVPDAVTGSDLPAGTAGGVHCSGLLCETVNSDPQGLNAEKHKVLANTTLSIFNVAFANIDVKPVFLKIFFVDFFNKIVIVLLYTTLK